MGRTAGLIVLAMCAPACNLVLGLDPPIVRDGAAEDASAIDANPDERDAPPGDGDDTRADAASPDAASPDAPVCGTHDEDGDGVFDGCDTCPQVYAAQDDGDHDGVGNVCDPGPAVNHIAFFDSFAAGSAPSWISYGGTWAFGPDTYLQTGTSAQLPVANAARLITILGGFSISARLYPVIVTTGVQYHAVGVWLNASGFTTTADPSGYACSVTYDANTSRTYLQLVVSTGGSPHVLSELTMTNVPYAASAFDVTLHLHGSGILDCSAVYTNMAFLIQGVDTTYPSGQPGLHVIGNSAQIDWVVGIAEN